MSKKYVYAFGLMASVCVWAVPGAAEECSNRGELDTQYCDENNDLVADAPKSEEDWRDPDTLVWAYSPVEDPAIYANAFKPFTDYLEACLDKRIVYYPVQSNAAEIEAMRSGRLHFAGFSTGPTGFAVNLAGAVPFASKAKDGVAQNYNLIAVVRADSEFQTLGDLKGKRVAHTSPSSNSGNLAPIALFPAEGLDPKTDYTPLMSGGHDKSILGLTNGDYDMIAIADDILERMIARGDVNAEDYRIIYTSPDFPTSSFAYSNTLAPPLAEKLQQCFLDFTYPDEMAAEFEGDNGFAAISYQEDWAIVRDVAEKTGTPYNKAAYEAEKNK